MNWDTFGQPQGRALRTWRKIQLWFGTILFLAWTGGALSARPEMAIHPLQLGLMFVSLGFGLISLHWISRKRGKALNEWLGMLVFFVACMVIPFTIEVVARFAVFAGWVDAEAPSSTLSSSLAYALGLLIIPGVGLLWAYYGISRYGIPDQESGESVSE